MNTCYIRTKAVTCRCTSLQPHPPTTVPDTESSRTNKVPASLPTQSPSKALKPWMVTEHTFATPYAPCLVTRGVPGRFTDCIQHERSASPACNICYDELQAHSFLLCPSCSFEPLVPKWELKWEGGQERSPRSLTQAIHFVLLWHLHFSSCPHQPAHSPHKLCHMCCSLGPDFLSHRKQPRVFHELLNSWWFMSIPRN